MKVIIIDDEEPARILLRHYLQSIPDAELIAESSDGFAGVKAIRELNPDLILLDIQMPKLSGFEMLELLDVKPEIVFTTAFDEYAINAFELHAIDYLLKPFSLERFVQAMNRVKERLAKNAGEGKSKIEKLQVDIEKNSGPLERIVARKNDRLFVIPVDHIQYIKAEDDYVMIYAKEGEFLKEKTMKEYEDQLDPGQFIRIHRSYIVNVASISQVQLYEKDTYLVILKDGSKLRASRAGYKRLKELF